MFSINAEVTLIAYNKKTPSTRGACESVITGQVVRITPTYIWIRDYRDNSIWKSPRRYLEN